MLGSRLPSTRLPQTHLRLKRSLLVTPLVAQGRAALPSCAVRAADIVALGNLCVDVVVPVQELPPADKEFKRKLLDQLSGNPPDRSAWEVGGNCNTIIAAARLGLKVATVGHLGSDVYGRWMGDILREESVKAIEPVAPHITNSSSSSKENNSSSSSHNSNGSSNGSSKPSSDDSTSLDQTLLCFVLVDPHGKHAFCSRYDFGPWPLLSGVSSLPQSALQMLQNTRAVYMNGFIFDELPLSVVVNACNHAIAHGAAVFFDPGPRCMTMMEGSRREALDAVLDLSTVVLMTEEEALVVTGESDPEAAARIVLSRPGCRTQWAVVKMGGAGALLSCKHTGTTHVAAGIKVEVQDTVGCGDSFAAAIVLGYINKYPIQSTLALANAVGAATATGRGAGRNVANAPKVMQLLQDAAAASDAERQAHLGHALDILQLSLDGVAVQA